LIFSAHPPPYRGWHLFPCVRPCEARDSGSGPPRSQGSKRFSYNSAAGRGPVTS
jgi:hypothetical protein